MNGIQEVSGSIPLISTIEALKTIGFQGFLLFCGTFILLGTFDQSFDQNYEMSKKSNLFQEVGGSFLASRFFHLILATSHSVSLS